MLQLNKISIIAFLLGVVVSVISFMVLAVLPDHAANLEGKLHPVLDNITVLSVKSPSPAEALILIRADKIRQCNLQNIESMVTMPSGVELLAQADMVDTYGNIIYPGQIPIRLQSEYLRAIRVRPAGVRTQLKFQFLCHPAWDTAQLIIDIPIKHETVAHTLKDSS